MRRLLVILVLWLAAANMALAAAWPQECIHPITGGQSVDAILNNPNCTRTNGAGHGPFFVDVYSFFGTAGQQVTITMSTEFDACLELHDVDDDAFAIWPLAYDCKMGARNAIIPNFPLPATGTYYIWATTSFWLETGRYSLALFGAVGPPPTVTDTVVEYHHTGLDHYFITWMPNEIAILDAGTQIKGWMRTGHSFKTYTTAQAGTSPVCRYYIPPGLGDSHFFGRGTVECNATGQKNPTFVLEDPAFMQTFLPAAGACPASTTPVYRVFSNRVDANHRYMTDRSVRDQMVAKGWLAEGDGPDLVVMCAPQ